MKKLILTLAFAMGASVAHAQNFDAKAAGCNEGDFVTLTGPAEIAIAGGDYTPKCLEIRRSTHVTVDASNRHPLQGVGAGNPLFDEFGGAIRPLTVQFNETGTYGYFCVAHGDATGRGMAGVIRVVP